MQKWFSTLIVLCVTAAHAQTLHFDVVSIHRSNATPQQQHIDITADGYEAIGFPLQTTLLIAYAPAPFFKHLDDMKGLPSWATSERYDIRAKLAPADVAEWSRLDQNIMRTPPVLQAMLRQVLEERCNLKLHSQDIRTDVFALRLINKSPALQEDSSVPPGGEGSKLLDGARFTFAKQNGEQTYTFYNTSMSVFVNFLTIPAAHPVVDRTGLQGRYQFKLQRIVTSPQPGNDAEPQVDAPVPYDLRTIGLTISKEKADGKQWIVDSITRPTEN